MAISIDKDPVCNWGIDLDLDSYILDKARTWLEEVEEAENMARSGRALHAAIARDKRARFNEWVYTVARCHGETYVKVMERILAS
jgi:hypothetical protein